MDAYKYSDWLTPIGELYPELKGQDGFISV